MATVTNREQFTDYCLRKLGFPVIEINVDPDQVQDRVDDALQYFQDYHFDGLQKTYYIHAITQQDIDNRYLDLSNVTDNSNNATTVVGVTRIFPMYDSQASISMFDLRYQLRLNELYDFTSASYINYTMTMQHLRMLEQLFVGEVPIRYQRHMEKLFIDWAWGQQQAPVGQIVVVECYTIINPNVYNRVWDDRWLKRYATALIKRQWGENLKKFGNIQLPGGVVLNGDKIFEEAMQDIKDLEEDMENNYGGGSGGAASSVSVTSVGGLFGGGGGGKAYQVSATSSSGQAGGGKAVQTNGNSVSWVSGDTSRVYGAVG